MSLRRYIALIALLSGQLGCHEGDAIGDRAAQLIGGQPVDDPAVLMMRIEDPMGPRLCTATAIGPFAAITAKHCVAGRAASEITLFATGDQAALGTPIRVAEIHATPGEWVDDLTYQNLATDMAALYVETQLPVAPIDVAYDTPAIDLLGETAGFGIFDLTTRALGVERHAPARVIGTGDGLIVIRPQAAGLCGGDSGGPLFDDQGRILAVTSAGSATCELEVHVFTVALGGHAELVTAAVQHRCMEAGTCPAPPPPVEPPVEPPPDPGPPPDMPTDPPPDSPAPDAGTQPDPTPNPTSDAGPMGNVDRGNPAPRAYGVAPAYAPPHGGLADHGGCAVSSNRGSVFTWILIALAALLGRRRR